MKCLDFNKGWNDQGYLGGENNENESRVNMSWIFHVKGWSVYGLKRLATMTADVHEVTTKQKRFQIGETQICDRKCNTILVVSNWID